MEEVLHFSISQELQKPWQEEAIRASVGHPLTSLCTSPELSIPCWSQRSCITQHELLITHYKVQLRIPSLPGVPRLSDFSIWADYFRNRGLFEHCSAPERFSRCGDGNACTLSHTPHTHTCSLPTIPFSHPQKNSVSHRDTITASAALVPKSSPALRHVHKLSPFFCPTVCWLGSPFSAGSSPRNYTRT